MIAIIDDDQAARLSTARLVESQGYEARSFASGHAFLRAREGEGFACALLDLDMPGLSGLDVLRALGGQSDAPAVLVLTGRADIPMAVEAMKLNALDVIEKPYAPAALLKALERASARRTENRALGEAGREARALVEGLSERQRQILDGIVAGSPNKVIAWQLGLSVRTVESYRAQAFERLGARNTAEAVRIALAAGFDGAGRE